MTAPKKGETHYARTFSARFTLLIPLFPLMRCGPLLSAVPRPKVRPSAACCNDNLKQHKYASITTCQPDAKSNPNPNPATKQHAVVNIQLNSTADIHGRRALRSVGTNRLVVSPVRLTTVGIRAFPVAAAQIWNSLPEHIVSAPTLQSFRRHLITFFY